MTTDISTRLVKLQKEIKRPLEKLSRPERRKHRRRFMRCSWCGRNTRVIKKGLYEPYCEKCRQLLKYSDVYNTQKPIVRMNIDEVRKTIRDYEGAYDD